MKKGLLVIGALAIVIATVPMFAAFEAHVINVTAHIENALSVSSDKLSFDTVFPQEYVKIPFDISLSSSFMQQNRLADVKYKIEQKPKCIKDGVHYQCVPDASGSCICPQDTTQMLDLCRFLSKLPKDGDGNDKGHPSYFVDPDETPGHPDGDESCVPPTQMATGKLDRRVNDTSDRWVVDLKVPPVAGFVGQDWPTTCADYVVERDSQDYGCDLWIEVTGFSRYCPKGATTLEDGGECTPLPDGV